MKEFNIILFGMLLVILGVQPAWSQERGSIQGTIYVSDGETVVTDASVTLVGLNYAQRVNEIGQFLFEDIPAGPVLIRVDSPEWGRNSKTVNVVSGETVEVGIEVLMHIRLEELVVSAGPIALPRSELVNPVNVLTGSDLLHAGGFNLGESLKNQAGIASTYYGPGASRPIIGGVGGSRVKILQHGLDIGDVSDQSEDHAVGADVLDAERIEIIRGPATLLYGTEITGGVVNVLDGRVPNERPVNRIEGAITGRGGLGARERSGSGSLTGSFGNVVWRAAGLLRETAEVSTPLFNPEGIHEDHDHEEHEDHDHEEHEDHDHEEHEDHDHEEHEDHDHEEHEDHDHEEHEDHDHEEHELELVDHIENSETSLSRGSFGLSWLSNRGYIGAAVSFHNTDYGVPGPGHMHGSHEDDHDDHEDHDEDDHEDHDEDDHEDHEDDHGHHEEGTANVLIDLNSVAYDIEGAYRFENPTIQGLRFRLGISDYTHTELESFTSGESEVGIVYDNNQWVGRLELDHSLSQKTKGVVGVHAKRRDLDLSSVSSHGSNLPNTLTNDLAIFAKERIDLGSMKVELSGRFQWQSHEPVQRMMRSFSAFSIGGGVNYKASQQLSFSLSLARAAKIPSSSELYFNGVHAGIRAVEIGNENLDVEVTNNATISGFINLSPLRMSLTGYLNQSENFIYLAPTGEVQDERPVLRTDQSEATITGVEAEADLELFNSGSSLLTMELFGDYVNGRLTSEGGYLPRTPPLRLGASLQYDLNNFVANLSVMRTSKQDKVFVVAEDETDGYTTFDARVGYRILIGSTVQSISLQGMNLTNTLAQVHTSLLKNNVPLPGRDIRLVYSVNF